MKLKKSQYKKKLIITNTHSHRTKHIVCSQLITLYTEI